MSSTPDTPAETQITPEIAVETVTDETTALAKVRPPLTPEQREQKNARDRERRAEKSAAKAAAKAAEAHRLAGYTNYSCSPDATYEGSIGQQQAQRDKPFKQALSASIQAQDEARAARRHSNQNRVPVKK